MRIHFMVFAFLALVTVTSTPMLRAEETPQPALVFYASSSGKPTFDQGEGGGNPFASALVELLQSRDLGLGAFSTQLRVLTVKKSGGRQQPEVPSSPHPADWKIAPKAEGERRVALVLVYSDYSGLGEAKSLPGAKRDAGRVSDALNAAGFETKSILDPIRAHLGDELAAFASRSEGADVALVYTTGHGVQVAGKVYLLPGDFPVSQRAGALAEFAIPLDAISAVPRAKRTNLVMYGGCRDNPF